MASGDLHPMIIIGFIKHTADKSEFCINWKTHGNCEFNKSQRLWEEKSKYYINDKTHNY